MSAASAAQIDELLESLADKSYGLVGGHGTGHHAATPIVLSLVRNLANSFCRTGPDIAQAFAW